MKKPEKKQQGFKELKTAELKTVVGGGTIVRGQTASYGRGVGQDNYS